ncbi:ATP-binding protein [Metabacillus halosaccharovorans]|uniref:ATP-binding protein n=1 Tax=Metabacillus halosaccharovorans TaxID=930124 RepID=A0ABT3DGV0_9BACI|nr:ATP-binding protein [Metabacillus halosaccharovorans]MCV9886267.1 ATP-binding protein [Metabacillus halosaccharovorans]
MEALRNRVPVPLQEGKLEDYDQSQRDYQCPKCKDQTGFIEVRDGGEVWVRCDCIKWRKVKSLMKASEITNEFKKLGFQNFNTKDKPTIIKDVYETALEYFQEFQAIKGQRKNSIALLGQPGSGKTHLLTAISNNLISRLHVPVLYFPYVEGFNDLKDDFNQLEIKLERMKNIEVLFIDDLFKPVRGKPRATEWQVEQMYSVINYRYLNHKPILISSELTVDEIVDIDEALGTRIFQMCQNYIVVIKGDRKILNHRLAGVQYV